VGTEGGKFFHWSKTDIIININNNCLKEQYINKIKYSEIIMIFYCYITNI
jgi:hypothetical protein